MAGIEANVGKRELEGNKSVCLSLQDISPILVCKIHLVARRCTRSTCAFRETWAGDQTWVAQQSYDLTRDKDGARRVDTSVSNGHVRFRSLRNLLSLAVMVYIWEYQDNVPVIVTPRSFSADTRTSCVLFRMYS